MTRKETLLFQLAEISFSLTKGSEYSEGEGAEKRTIHK
jgi:hypothetical protein